MKLAEALEAYKKACILYGYNVGREGGAWAGHVCHRVTLGLIRYLAVQLK